MMHCNIKYHSGDVDLKFGRYSNNRLAVVLVDSQNGERISVATVNIPDCSIGEDEIILKNWSENEGILDFFIDNGLVINEGKEAPTGHVFGNVVKVTDKLKAIAGDAY